MPPVVRPVPNVDTPVEYPVSLFFDFSTGEIVTDQRGRVVETDGGHHAWVQSLAFAAITQRYAYPIFSDQMGIDFDSIRQPPCNCAVTREYVETRFVSELTAAFMADPRTSQVDSFAFRWDGSTCYASCRVFPAYGSAETVTITLWAP